MYLRIFAVKNNTFRYINVWPLMRAQHFVIDIALTLLYTGTQELSFKEGYLVKSNQVCTTMEIEISDCQPTIAINVFYCYKDLI
jgi:hypothetical protein